MDTEKNNLIARMTKSYRMINTMISNQISSELPFTKRLMIYLDYRMEKLLHGIGTANYFEYEFYMKNQNCRRTFACKRECDKIYNICNPKEKRYITGNKAVFNKKFSKFLGRKWLSVYDSSYEEFCDFIHSLDCVFVKPEGGECGIGACKIKNDGTLNLQELYDKYKQAHVMLEEVIHQHKSLAELNVSSVNTIRVVTYRDDHDEVFIMGCVLRIGRKGGVADNFHYNGMCAAIDKEEGIVYSSAIDHAHNRYIVHPDSGTPIVGFKIPYWDRILQTVKNAALEMNDLRYIGWDVSVGSNGEIYIIEGNSEPDLDVLQIADQVGKLQLHKAAIKGL